MANLVSLTTTQIAHSPYDAAGGACFLLERVHQELILETAETEDVDPALEARTIHSHSLHWRDIRAGHQVLEFAASPAVTLPVSADRD